MKLKKNIYLFSSVFAVLTLILMIGSVKFILKQDITLQNIIAYLILALIIAVIAGIFSNLKRYYGLVIFSIAYAIGFGTMIYTFMLNLSGWSDLIGFLQMLMTLGIGFAIAAVVETILHFKDEKSKF